MKAAIAPPVPAIIAFGAAHAGDFAVAEFEGALSRAFAADPGGFVTLDSHPHGQRFLAACAAWAIGQGLLYVDQVADDGQSEICALRLTEAGRARFGEPR